MAALALGAGNLTTIGVGATVVLVIVGVLLALLLTAIVARVIIAIVVIVLAVFVWQQRGSIEHKIDQKVCPPSLSFFGVHIDAPHSLKRYCRTHRG